MAHIRILELSKHFGDVRALDGLNLEVEDKQFVTLLGPSGCGKSTALNLIAGLETPTSGEIYLDGVLVNRVPPAARDVAMVFQSYALYPHMSVRDNLSFSLRIRKVPKAEIGTKVAEVSKMLGIDMLLNRRPRELSGGQRQRVALGRAIVRDPKVFLLDEPLSNLDAALRMQMRTELKILLDRLEATAVYVTHDQAEAMTMSDSIAVLRNGLLQQVGTPLEIYYKPTNLFVAGFVGSPTMNFAPCTLTDRGTPVLKTADFSLPLPAETQSGNLRTCQGRKLIMGVRPEDLHLGSGNGQYEIPATCMVVELLGSTTLLTAKTGENTYTVELPGATRIRPGESILLSLDPDTLYLFDAESEEALLTPGYLAI